MNQAQKKVLLISGAIATATLLPFLAAERWSSAQPRTAWSMAQPGKGLAAAQAKAPGAATLQTWRNVGKAYYEQGKYTESADEFQKVVKSGHAVATDYLDLGLANTQANNWETAGELAPHEWMHWSAGGREAMREPPIHLAAPRADTAPRKTTTRRRESGAETHSVSGRRRARR